MDLSKDARALLNAARQAETAPIVSRQRVRTRLVNVIAAGTVGVSAAVAKGATLTALGTATQVGPALTAGGSLTASLLSAVATGLALGMVAITPASKVDREAAAAPSVATAASSTLARSRSDESSRSAPYASSEPLGLPKPSATPGATMTAEQPPPALDRTARQLTSAMTSEGFGAGEPPASPTPPPAVASVAVLAASKASIARETELLASVQRALQQGRPATALSILNRYSTEFPQGELREESVASRVVALCDFGRRADAERWRAEFLRRYPNSPLSARVRAACQAAVAQPTTHPGIEK